MKNLGISPLKLFLFPPIKINTKFLKSKVRTSRYMNNKSRFEICRLNLTFRRGFGSQRFGKEISGVEQLKKADDSVEELFFELWVVDAVSLEEMRQFGVDVLT